jgi:hypothetical protein
VIDNGVGIPAENLTRIFQHGFTTKKGGHGFGLHVSANAATEMGAKLHAKSDGPGKGATFWLDIPMEEDLAERGLSHDREPNLRSSGRRPGVDPGLRQDPDAARRRARFQRAPGLRRSPGRA